MNSGVFCRIYIHSLIVVDFSQKAQNGFVLVVAFRLPGKIYCILIITIDVDGRESVFFEEAVIEPFSRS
jgi:hypothetical protein